MSASLVLQGMGDSFYVYFRVCPLVLFHSHMRGPAHHFKKSAEFLSLAWIILFILFYAPAAFLIGRLFTLVRQKHGDRPTLDESDRHNMRFLKQNLRLFVVRASITLLWSAALLALIVYLIFKSAPRELKADKSATSGGFSNCVLVTVIITQGINAVFNLGASMVHLTKIFLHQREQKIRRASPGLGKVLLSI